MFPSFFNEITDFDIYSSSSNPRPVFSVSSTISLSYFLFIYFISKIWLLGIIISLIFTGSLKFICFSKKLNHAKLRFSVDICNSKNTHSTKTFLPKRSDKCSFIWKFYWRYTIQNSISAVKIVKNLFKKSWDSGDDIYVLKPTTSKKHS